MRKVASAVVGEMLRRPLLCSKLVCGGGAFVSGASGHRTEEALGEGAR